MPNIKSQKKRVITSAKAAIANKAVKSNLKSTLKKADVAIADNAEDKESVLRAAVSTVDKAAKKGIIKKNTANRRKAALARKASAVKSAE